MQVSVVVPVYNPGRDIDRCIASLLGQTLPPSDFEAIFVDDGSTDETPARLDALAAEHPHIRVIHIPNSGWPGKPRNVGVDAARGAYVQFVDQDDHLGADALRRLVDMAERNRSDIVIGKVTSDFRGVPHGLFTSDRQSCTIHDAPLIDSLTPHKMFRRAFLDDHGIRFPEGPHILEDQIFMVRCYFRASVVSILASYPCYFYQERTDRSNAASRPINPPVYYRNLREVMDVVVANTAPGDFRDQLLRRSYRVEMLGRLGEPVYPGLDPALRESLVTSIRALAEDHVTERVHAGLAPALRVRSSIVRSPREDAAEALTELARRAVEIRPDATLESLTWTRGRCQVGITIHAPDGAGRRAFRLLRRGERTFLDPALTADVLAEPVEVTSDLASFRVHVSVRNVRDLVEWRAGSRKTIEFVEDGPAAEGGQWLRPVIRVEATLDLASLAVGQPLTDGEWEVHLRVVLMGFDRRLTVAVPNDLASVSAGPGWLDASRRAVTWVLSDGPGLRLSVRPASLTGLVDSVRIAPSGGRELVVSLPVASTPIAERQVVAILREGARERATRASLRAPRGHLEVAVRPGWRPGFVRRRRTLHLLLDGPGGGEVAVGTVQTGWDGRSFIDGARRISIPASSRNRVIASAQALARRMPPPVKRTARRLLRRLRGQ